MHYAKHRGNKEIPLAILSSKLAKLCVILCLNYRIAGNYRVVPNFISDREVCETLTGRSSDAGILYDTTPETQ